MFVTTAIISCLPPQYIHVRLSDHRILSNRFGYLQTKQSSCYNTQQMVMYVVMPFLPRCLLKNIFLFDILRKVSQFFEESFAVFFKKVSQVFEESFAVSCLFVFLNQIDAAERCPGHYNCQVRPSVRPFVRSSSKLKNQL